MSENESQGGGDRPQPQEPIPGADKPRPSEQGTLEEQAAARERALRENIPGRHGDEPPGETADRLEETKLQPIGDAPKEKPHEKPFRGRGQNNRPRRKRKNPELD